MEEEEEAAMLSFDGRVLVDLDVDGKWWLADTLVQEIINLDLELS